jgi:hypothetical protein
MSKGVLRRGLITALLAAAALAPAGPTAVAGGDTHTKTFDVSVVCAPPSTICPQEFKARVKTSDLLRVNFTASELHCTPMAISIFAKDSKGDFLDGGDHFLDPGESTGWKGLPGGKPGRMRVFLGNVQDLPGGSCPDGPVASWGGKLKVKVSS